MNFIKTQKLLTQQAGQREIPLEAAMELMRTYLTELRHHTNTSVDKCPIENVTQLITSLAAVSNAILFVYRTNEHRIQAAESQYTQVLVKAQNACGDYHSRITQLDQQIHLENAALVQLEALKKQQMDRAAVLAELQQKSTSLQAEIDALCTDDSETEAGKLKALLESQTAALAQAKEEYAAMQQAHSQNQAELETENARLAQLRSEVAAAKVKLKETEQDILDQQDVRAGIIQKTLQLEHEICKLKEDNDNAYDAQFDMIDQIEQDKAKLEKQLEENNQRMKLIAEAQEKLEALQRKHAQDQDLYRQLTEQAAVLQADQESLEAQIQARQLEIQRITEAGGAALDQINALTDQQQKLKADYQDACQLRLTRQQEVDALVQKLEQLNQDSALIQANINEKAAEVSQLSDQHQEKSAQLNMLSARVSELQTQLQQLQDASSRHRTDILAAEEALKDDQAEFDQLLEQLVSLNVDVEAQKTANRIFITDQLEPVKAQMAALVVDARKEQDQHEELKNSIKLLEEKHASLVKKNVMLLANLKGWQQQLEKVQAEYEKNQQAVAALNADLEIKSSESRALLEREKELRELLDEKNVARITAELESCNKRLEEDLVRAEQTEQTLAVQLQKVDKLSTQLTAALAELEAYRSQEAELAQNYKAASQDLDRITSPENRLRSETLTKQLQLMRAMIAQLTSHSIVPCGKGFEVPELLQEHLTQAEATLLTLRSVILEYTTLRQQLLENNE